MDGIFGDCTINATFHVEKKISSGWMPSIDCTATTQRQCICLEMRVPVSEQQPTQDQLLLFQVYHGVMVL
jgi:hypothetical protein